MSKSTPNLGLFEYDPSTDGDKTFNIRQALNENWEKLDNLTAEQVGAVKIGWYDGDLNTLLTDGHYRLGGNVTNGPPSAAWGQIVVLNGKNTDAAAQILVDISGHVFSRRVGYGAPAAITAWQQIATTADLAGYLPLSGGTLTQSLGVAGGYGLFTADQNSAFFQYQTAAERHGFVAYSDSIKGITDGNRFQVFSENNGGSSSYLLIHSGNISNYLSYHSKIEVGSYVGTGEAMKSLVLPFSPKFLKIYTIDGFINKGYSRIGEESTAYWISGMEYLAYIDDANSSGMVGRPITVDGNTVSWRLNSYASSSAAEKAKEAMNAANYTYHYVAFG